MHFSKYRSRPQRYIYVLIMLMGAALLLVAVRWSGLVKSYYNSRQVATLPQAPPLLVEDCHYGLCGHTTQQSRELTAELRTLSPKEIAQLNNANTYQVSQEKLQIFSDQPGLCPDCQEHIFVGLDGDEVAVYCGVPGGPRQLKERTQIRVDNLPPQAMADLLAGIPVADSEELLHVLEGLMN